MSDEDEPEPVRTDRLRVLIADDEAMARMRLARLLGALPDVAIAGECTDGDEVLARIEGGDVDVVLLDIHMPRLTGVEALALMGEGGPVVVFTTAHPDFAVAAFDGGAVDYVLKPIEPARLRKALDRARERLHPRRDVPAATAGRIALPTRKGITLLDPSDILYAAIEGETVVVHTTRGPLFTDFRLNELETRLPAERFLRVHRRALVNLARIERLDDVESGGYLAIFADSSRIGVSRQVARRLRRAWDLAR
ncbi:MAG: response regulator transcription factor [Deltaproteobacteria bacterium]|nr:response regulator transcription factor [Deltaproteobacteria bacterium]